MTQQTIHNTIVQYLKDFNPEYVGLFGSYIKGENIANSDIDILVKFKKSLSLLELIRIENELSGKLGIEVDLVTEGSLTNERIRDNIQKNLKLIYET